MNGVVRRLAAAGAGVAMLATTAVGLTALPAAAKATKGVYATVPVATPKNHKGECPVDVTFTSKIKVKVKGKTTVSYRWLHGDGSKSKVKKVTLRGNGVKYLTVKEKVTFKDDVTGWQALQVLAPVKTTTKKGHFSVSCQASNPDAIVFKRPNWAKASVDVEDYRGVCKPYTKVTAEGVIRVGEPTWVKYRWIHNGKVVDSGKTKVYGAKKVYYSFHPRHSHNGWVKLDIVSPRRNVDARDSYTVTCVKPIDRPRPAKAWASVSGPGAYKGVCPVGRVFKGTVSVNRGTVVKYRWAGPGYTGPVETLYFGKHGPKSKVVAHTVKFTDSGVARRWIEVLSPNGSVSNVGAARVECAKPTPPTPPAKVTGVSVTAAPAACEAGKAPAVNVTGTISVNGKTTVAYRWVLNGKTVQSGTAEVDGTATVSLAVDPASQGDKTSGVVALVVTGPNLEKAVKHFSFSCPSQATTA